MAPAATAQTHPAYRLLSCAVPGFPALVTLSPFFVPPAPALSLGGARSFFPLLTWPCLNLLFSFYTFYITMLPIPCVKFPLFETRVCFLLPSWTLD